MNTNVLTPESVRDCANNAQILRGQLEASIIGQPALVQTLMLGTLTGKPVALVGPPGVAKSHGSKLIGCLIGTEDTYKRIQTMADMLPSDFTGSSVAITMINDDGEKTQEFVFRPGPLFGQVVHFDEFNRVGGRALSGVLEAMEERQVTVDGITRPLPPGQVIVATFNPRESAGTEDLPDAIIDRFIVQVTIGHLSSSDRVYMAQQYFKGGLDYPTKPLLTPEQVVTLQRVTRAVASNTPQEVYEYAESIVLKTMNNTVFERAAGERALLALIHAASAVALMDGRASITVDDVKTVAPWVLQHRVELQRSINMSIEQAIKELL